MFLLGKCLLFPGTAALAELKGGKPRWLPANVLLFACTFPHCVDCSTREDPAPPGGQQTGPLSPSLSEESAGFRGQQRASRDRRIQLAGSQAALELAGPSLGFLRTPPAPISGEGFRGPYLARRLFIPFCILNFKFSPRVKGPWMKSVVLSPSCMFNSPGAL